MLFRLVSNLQSSCLCCFKKKKTLRCNEIFWLVVFSSYSVISLRDILSETILFFYMSDWNVFIEKSSYIYHPIMCCYTVPSLCCFSVRIKFVSIPTPLFLNSGLTLTQCTSSLSRILFSTCVYFLFCSLPATGFLSPSYLAGSRPVAFPEALKGLLIVVLFWYL